MPDVYQRQIDLGIFAGNGLSSHSAAINAAGEASAGRNLPIVSQPWTYKIDADVTLPPNFDLRVATFEVYNGAKIIVGNGQSTTMGGECRLPKIVNKGAKWTGTGVQLSNLFSCQVHVGNVVDFGVGVDLAADAGTMTAYNTVFVGDLENNLVNMRLQPRSPASAVNQNTFIGGRYRHYSTPGNAIIAGSRHIQIIPHDVADETGSWPNNNVWLNPSVEGHNQEQHIEVSGAYNRLINSRFEAVEPRILLRGHATVEKTSRNTFDGGYGLQNVAFTKQGRVDRTMVAGPGGIAMSPSGIPLNLSNGHSGAEPIMQGFGAGVDPLGKDHTATDYAFQLSALGLAGKRTTDTYPRIFVDFQNGVVKTGNGTVPPA